MCSSKSWLRLPIAPILIIFICLFGTIACSSSGRVLAQDRLFLNRSLEFLDAVTLPRQAFAETPVGGLSAIAYDRQRGIYYALSDDRGNRAPARFYTLQIDLSPDRTQIQAVEIAGVKYLQTPEGELFAPGSLDPEGLAIAPGNSLYISSEGSPRDGVEPFIARFDLATGRQLDQLPLPERYLPRIEGDRGIKENRGFEALTLGTTGLSDVDPYRVFAATESTLEQDELPLDAPSDIPARVRVLHYAINSVSAPTLVAEHVYLLDLAPLGTAANGLTELVALPTEGYFLSLERTYSPLQGNGAKIFQIAVGNATDTSQVGSLSSSLGQIVPLKKRLLLDLSTLDYPLDNLEGMTLGPLLPDGSQSLLLISDDNFSEKQTTQLLLLRLVKG
ncbi:hypothetical protein KR51_00032700 [Rubidibacter lacunae KORDI 51-2]|uniref:Phytase-like domain-containing protein n=1 Tax=Rubidibacter lacunae KORDI 51-2 TaxID=582515 RepID=U5DFE3_9CHRO|nr:esterase-like activity of phytase family protein [Rubidibacter lacunae]ERN40321.1 hypothetical protein KR51_00032700 [Rubidibacter lacunae KORDI 51-2]